MAAATEHPLRVMRVLTRANLGGPTRQAIALWHAHRDLGVNTLLVTGAVGTAEQLLSPADAGVPEVDGDLAAEQAGGWLTVGELRRGIDPFTDRRARRRLRAIMRSFRPHVVHTHTSKAGFLGRRAAWAERVPVTAHTFHGHVLQDYFGRLPSFLLARLERRLAHRTDLLFAVSASCADELAAVGVAPRLRLCVVPPAVAIEQLLARPEARRRLDIRAGERRVAAVGRLVAIKRLEHFVQAVAQIPDLRGDLIGDGPERRRLADLGERLAPGRIALRGARPDIATLLAAYDAVVLPSVREGLPLVAVEAFAAGVPVIGYDVPGVRDALAGLGQGVLVPPAAGPAGIACALRDLLADTNGRSRLVAAAGQAVAKCSPAAVAAQLLAAYREAAAVSPRTRYHFDRPG